MRKIIILVFIGIFVFAGCGASEDTGILKLTEIAFGANIRYQNEKYTAECNIKNSHNLSVKMLSPDTVKSLEFIVKDDECKISLDNIEINDSEAFYPQNSIFITLYKIVKESNGREFAASKSGCKYCGNIDGNDFLFTVSPGGLPISLEIKALEFKMTFNNLKVIK